MIEANITALEKLEGIASWWYVIITPRDRDVLLLTYPKGPVFATPNYRVAVDHATFLRRRGCDCLIDTVRNTQNKLIKGPIYVGTK